MADELPAAAAVAGRLDGARLHGERRRYRGSAGESRLAGGRGLRPAFRDECTGEVQPACFADGRPAPVHVLEGLPAAWVVERDQRGRPVAVRPGVVCGFLRAGRFYTRAEAAAAFAAGDPAS